MRDDKVLPGSLQIGTLKELHLFFDFSDRLFSYGFGSVGSISKNMIDVARLGG